VVLVVCSVLFLRTLLNAYNISPGFSTRNGLLATVDLLPAGYDDARGALFFRTLLARLREAPGVESVTTVGRMPLTLGGTSDTSFTVDGYTPAPREEMSTLWNHVGPDYLETLGIGIVSGRDIGERDVAGAREVAVINETLARRYFAGRDPIGGRLRLGGRIVEVVGVARDGKYGSITEDPRSSLYIPVLQWYRPDATLVVKTAGDPLAVVPGLQAIVRELDSNLPLFEVRTMAEHLETATFMQRMAASLVSGLGVIALFLAAVGLYGVIAGSVVQRMPEIGMRVALGASRRDIVGLILRQGARITLVGLGLGLAMALAATRLLTGLLVGVSANDGVSYVVTVLVLAVVALAATVLPARRAVSVDVIAALRHG
jgi:predicted permease